MPWDNQKLLISEAQKHAGCGVDGRWGPNTERAINRVLEDNHGMSLLEALVNNGEEPSKKITTPKDIKFPNHNIPWLIVADTLEGIAEIKGKKDNPLIIKMAHETGNTWVKNDETAWCSFAMCYVMMKAGFDHTGSGAAKSWEVYGVACDVGVGCIVILDRSKPGVPKTAWWRHVGLVREVYGNGKVALQGGNQSNKYCTKTYSLSRLKSARLPIGWKMLNGVAVKA